ncbi:amino acid adenylation domain-containing protein, partial [Pyxidicoccus sp. 3LFB2]
NGYGPTENTTFSTCCRMEGPEQWSTSVPIGRPISNTSAYVLDEALHPVPVGVPGELYVGGEGLARGYVGRPELTAERFIPNPFADGERLYRTGDVVRWRSDGTLDFIGRRDGQVKVRGYRIETGEVETALTSHPAIHEAAVVAREDGTEGKRLVAYVTKKDAAEVDVSHLRAHLKQRLPEYMVPSVYVVLHALPLTRNGKVDRKALPAPEQVGSEGKHFAAPHTETEQKLAAIFEEVLHIERVGLHDDFFELGGHSLLATQLVSRIREAFQVELPLRDVFESPTVETLARRLDSTPEAGGPLKAPPLGRGARDQALPLSFAQQRLWFLDQLEPGSSFYNVPVSVKLTGTLDFRALERSFEALVHRHEPLRTTFSTENGLPVQRIAREVQARLEVVDLSHRPGPTYVEEAKRFAEKEARQPFDLERGPLLRTTLLKLSEQEHVLVLVMHHIVSDGWSMSILVREVAALYEAYAQGREPSLPELPVQYADYAVWQREWLKGEVLEAQLDYWRKQLEGAPRALELPTDRPRPAVQSFRGDHRAFQWPRGLRDAVKALAQREGATPFMVLLAAFQTVLARYSGQDDVCVGTAIANRNRAETEGLMGFFVNTLVLRTKLEPGTRFQELVGKVKEVTLGAYAHQDVPFEKLVEELQPERDLGRGPLFQVMFVLQNAPVAALNLPELKLEVTESSSRTSKFDLTLAMTETDEGLAGSAEFNIDLFEPETVDRLLGHLRVLLEAAVARPEQRLMDLPLTDAEERRRLVDAWSGRKVAYAREQSLAELFEAQVMKTPDAVAVEYQGETLKYAELNGRANQLAHHLRSLGVGPEVRVGLCVERSLELVVSMLGILKAGGVYVPLDANYPRERLAWMRREAGVVLLVAQEHLARAVRLSDEEPVVHIDTHWQELISRQPRGNLPTRVAGDHLAYVMFTSGSTGQPKGVGVPQRAVSRLVLDTDYARFGPDEVWLQLAPISFDASTLELWGALLHGAKLVVYPAGTPTLEELGRALGQYGITSLWLTAALFEQLQARQPEELARVKQVLAGGDVLPVGRVKERLASGGLLINGYGPTENTTFSTCCRMDGPVELGASVPIGGPIPNSSAYVLDEALHPVPVGVPGELYVGGEGLARGYVGRPDLTAERFIPNPFGNGERLYRTGDVVRWRSDGTLDFIGRRDGQVKVRGYRIETGEVETALTSHPAIHEAVVVARGEGVEDKRLVAYVTAKQGAQLDATTLRAHLKQRLPEYMVPTAYVVLGMLPLTPAGKVDRKALPEPGAQSAGPHQGYEAPRSPVEQVLAGLWSDVLRLERVGVHDDFFALGGHSLLATQLVSRVRAALQVELPLRELFEAPTLTRFARRVELARARDSVPQAPPLERAAREGALPLSFAQQRLWFLEQLSPGNTVYNMPSVVRLTGTLDASALQRAFDELVRRHEALRTSFHVVRGEPVQVIEPRGLAPSTTVDLSHLPAAARATEARRRAQDESQRPFDLEKGPLLRTSLLKLSEQEHVLVLVMHHIVSDGWSMGLLVDELARLYAAFSQGRSSPLPELPVQYADYAVW